MVKFITEFEGDDGWSQWLMPIERGYKIACCDCGLVHNMEFRVNDEGRAEFRAQRNNRSTGQKRRHRKD